MTWHDEFEALSRQICMVNEHLILPLHGVPDAERKPVDRVNDAALIVFHVFAFEDFCRNYVSEERSRKQEKCGLRSSLLRALAKEFKRAGKRDEVQPTLSAVDEVITIRDLYAHRLGKRKGLGVASCLTPEVLRKYEFEADGCEDDIDARWWPKRDKAFRACVRPLQRLARQVASALDGA